MEVFRLKILVVDDSLLDRKLLISILKKSGIESEILQASDGEEGLSILSKNHSEIGLVIVDWQMPKMDGIEFMKAVINVPEVSSIPIIMLTASGSEESRKKAYETNPKLAGYVVKPYAPDTLLHTIAPFIK